MSQYWNYHILIHFRREQRTAPIPKYFQLHHILISTYITSLWTKFIKNGLQTEWILFNPFSTNFAHRDSSWNIRVLLLTTKLLTLQRVIDTQEQRKTNSKPLNNVISQTRKWRTSFYWINKLGGEVQSR